jgi:hypothetical protein
MFRENPSNLKRFASGATARTCAVLCLMPVNVIKIRFEVMQRNSFLVVFPQTCAHIIYIYGQKYIIPFRVANTTIEQFPRLSVTFGQLKVYEVLG